MAGQLSDFVELFNDSNPVLPDSANNITPCYILATSGLVTLCLYKAMLIASWDQEEPPSKEQEIEADELLRLLVAEPWGRC